MSSSKRGDDKSSSLLVGSIAAAATVGAACMWTYKKWESNKKYRIPPALIKSPYAKEIRLATNAALKAGKNIADYCDVKGTEAEDSYDLGIEIKGAPSDFCTKIDVLNEDLVTDAIRKTFPSHEIIGEESTGTGAIPALTSTNTWIIDPIDGTTNFSQGLPLACVSIAFCVNQRPVMGVVYAPMTDEFYVAVMGHGAFRNGVRLTQRKPIKLEKAVVEFEFGYPRSKEAVKKMVTAVQHFMERGCLATRQLGTGVLDLCYVATGRFSVVYSGVAGEGWKPWDYAAGLVIATEAGCSMESFHQKPGDPFDLYSESIICAVSKDLLDECREILVKI